MASVRDICETCMRSFFILAEHLEAKLYTNDPKDLTDYDGECLYAKPSKRIIYSRVVISITMCLICISILLKYISFFIACVGPPG